MQHGSRLGLLPLATILNKVISLGEITVEPEAHAVLLLMKFPPRLKPSSIRPRLLLATTTCKDSAFLFCTFLSFISIFVHHAAFFVESARAQRRLTMPQFLVFCIVVYFDVLGLEKHYRFQTFEVWLFLNNDNLVWWSILVEFKFIILSLKWRDVAECRLVALTLPIKMIHALSMILHSVYFEWIAQICTWSFLFCRILLKKRCTTLLI